MSKIQFGIDHFLAKKQHKSKCWGLVTNDAVFTQNLIPVRKALLESGYNIACLFSPEHGIEVIGADGQAMEHSKDKLTRLPVYSLYGDNLRPSYAILKHLDGILFDLPDIGVRFYTYIWTLSYIMETCNELHLPLIILDRPNPISGDLSLAEGAMLDEQMASSFIGRWNIPIRHSLTIGELALHWQSSRNLNDFDLEIIKVKGWKRKQFFQELNLPFVPTSPAISSVETLLTYPALCFMEGLNVSEGRGTAFPFRVCGAPFINGLELANRLNSIGLEGVNARPFSFMPSEGLYKNKTCHGIMLHITDKNTFRPVKTGLTLVFLLKTLYPDQIEWANYPTHVNKTGERHFDLLTGTPHVRECLEQNGQFFLEQLDNLLSVEDWIEKTKPFLLY